MHGSLRGGTGRPKSVSEDHDPRDDSDAELLAFLFSLVIGDMGPAWTIDEVLSLTYPRILWLQHGGKFPKAAVATNEGAALKMLQQYAQERGIPLDA